MQKFEKSKNPEADSQVSHKILLSLKMRRLSAEKNAE